MVIKRDEQLRGNPFQAFINRDFLHSLIYLRSQSLFYIFTNISFHSISFFLIFTKSVLFTIYCKKYSTISSILHIYFFRVPIFYKIYKNSQFICGTWMKKLVRNTLDNGRWTKSINLYYIVSKVLLYTILIDIVGLWMIHNFG